MLMAGGAGIAQAGTSPFVDIAGTPFEQDIEWLFAEGITRGCAPDRFCPDSPLSRGQLAAFFVRMFALPTTTTDFFTDDEDSSFESEINRLAASGITVGCTPTTYCPDASVRRDEMASFLVRAIPLTIGDGRNYFRDDAGSTHEADIDRLAAAGLTNGCNTWQYCPAEPITRGQVAAQLHRVESPLTTALPFPAPPIATLHVALTGTDTANDCLDPSQPCRTIGHALGLALDDDTIDVGPGTYAEEGLVLAQDVTITGDPGGGTIIDASAGDRRRIFTIPSGATVELHHLTLTGGREDHGGAIHNSGRLVIQSSTITGNRASEEGGGIFSLGDLTITASIFSDNWTRLFGGGVSSHDAQLAIIDSTFNANTVDIRGGGVYSEGGDTTISGSLFAGNSAREVGGVAFDGMAIGTMLTVTTSTFADNSANTAGGIGGSGAMSIDRSTFSGNTVTFHGGAIFSTGAPVTITNSTIADNNAGHLGGGIFWGDFSDDLTITNTTITGNHAAEQGGGAYGNNGGGSGMTLQNTVVAGNTSPSAPDIANLPGARIASIVGIPAGKTLAQIFDAAGLADNGGPTETIALVNSGTNPARGTADAAICAAAPVDGIDQRGLPRNSPCDVGAFEIQ